jgi:transposase InsO family protein
MLLEAVRWRPGTDQRRVANFTYLMMEQLVTDALVMVVWRRGKSEALWPQSDQGRQA